MFEKGGPQSLPRTATSSVPGQHVLQELPGLPIVGAMMGLHRPLSKSVFQDFYKLSENDLSSCRYIPGRSFRLCRCARCCCAALKRPKPWHVCQIHVLHCHTHGRGSCSIGSYLSNYIGSSSRSSRRRVRFRG